MDALSAIVFVLVVTVLFAVGGKLALHFKNREIALYKEQFDRELVTARKEHDNVRAALSEDLFKQLKRIEEAHKLKLDEKDEQMKALVVELESLKAWKDEMGLKLAEFKGASQGNPQMLIFKLLEHNQKLNKALLTKWDNIEKHMVDELSRTIEKFKKLFAETEALHRDGLEIISIYESRLPDEIKRKLHDELVKLPHSSASVPALTEK